MLSTLSIAFPCTLVKCNLCTLLFIYCKDMFNIWNVVVGHYRHFFSQSLFFSVTFLSTNLKTGQAYRMLLMCVWQRKCNIHSNCTNNRFCYGNANIYLEENRLSGVLKLKWVIFHNLNIRLLLYSFETYIIFLYQT